MFEYETIILIKTCCIPAFEVGGAASTLQSTYLAAPDRVSGDCLDPEILGTGSGKVCEVGAA